MVTNNYLSAPELSGTDCAIWTYPVIDEPAPCRLLAPKPEPIYKCDVFGDNAAVVIGTKWTKL